MHESATLAWVVIAVMFAVTFAAGWFARGHKG